MAVSESLQEVATALNESGGGSGEPRLGPEGQPEATKPDLSVLEGVSTLEQRKFWQENGFLILYGLIPVDVIAAVNTDIEATIQNRQNFQNVKVDSLEGPLVGRRMSIA